MILIRDLMRSIFGTYLPLVDYNGEPLQGLAAVDFEYVLGVILFIVTFYCFCRILESIFRRR